MWGDEAHMARYAGASGGEKPEQQKQEVVVVVARGGGRHCKQCQAVQSRLLM